MFSGVLHSVLVKNQGVSLLERLAVVEKTMLRTWYSSSQVLPNSSGNNLWMVLFPSLFWTCNDASTVSKCYNFNKVHFDLKIFHWFDNRFYSHEKIFGLAGSDQADEVVAFAHEGPEFESSQWQSTSPLGNLLLTPTPSLKNYVYCHFINKCSKKIKE